MPRLRSRVPAPQRQYIWSDVQTHLAAVTMGFAKNAAGLTALGVQTGGGLTLIRARGQAMIHFDPTTIADVFQVGIGLGVYSSDAFGIGQTAMPGPLSDADYDWIYHRVMIFGPASTATESEVSLMQNL